MTANTNGRAKKSRRRNQKKQPCAVQKLYDTCKLVFDSSCTGFIPSPDQMETLRSILDDIKPADVGVHPDMDCFRNSSDGNPAITYLHIIENENFSMGIFCLPPSAVIPLHNHPGMTVFSKLLFGKMRIKAYDWAIDGTINGSMIDDALNSANGEANTQPKVRLADVKVDTDFTAPCKPSILYPADGGNMHCFTAVTACAVLDVLGPPYSDADGRHCTYYQEFPFSDFKVDGLSIPEEESQSHGWLKEKEKPDELSFLGMMYSGPKIAI